jgi:hypothetical protein
MARITLITGPDTTPKMDYANLLAGISFIERITPMEMWPYYTYQEAGGTVYIAENLERDAIINLIDDAHNWQEDDVHVIIVTDFPVHRIDFAEMEGKVTAVLKMVGNAN